MVGCQYVYIRFGNERMRTVYWLCPTRRSDDPSNHCDRSLTCNALQVSTLPSLSRSEAHHAHRKLNLHDTHVPHFIPFASSTISLRQLPAIVSGSETQTLSSSSSLRRKILSESACTCFQCLGLHLGLTFLERAPDGCFPGNECSGCFPGNGGVVVRHQDTCPADLLVSLGHLDLKLGIGPIRMPLISSDVRLKVHTTAFVKVFACRLAHGKLSYQ